MTTFDRFKKILLDHLPVDEERVTREASIVDDLGADSLDAVEILMATEEEFGFEISDDDAEQCILVGDAVKFLERREGGAS